MAEASSILSAKFDRTAAANLKYFRIWAALLFLISFALGPLVLFTFGFFCFAILSVFWVSEPPKTQTLILDRVNGVILVLAAVWFLYNLILEVALVYTSEPHLALWLPLIGLAFLFPPVIMHGAYAEHSPGLTLGRGWKLAYRAAYPVSFAFALASLAAIFNLEPRGIFRLLVVLQISNFLLFCVTGVYGLTLSRMSIRHVRQDKRDWGNWNFFLYALATLLFLGLIAMLVLRTDLMAGGARLLNLFSVFARSLPLCFFFIGSYYENRFTFFDVFIKRGTFLFLLFIILAACLSVALPYIGMAPASFSKPRLLALFLLPIMMTLPAIYRLLERWLDRAWLGRSYSTVDAVKHFLGGMQDATSEAQMVECAERRLSEIFQADAQVVTDSGRIRSDFPFEAVREVPLPRRGEREGVIRMGRRVNDTPYFSADLALLSSLADVLSPLLENVRLQQKRREQEKKEQTLMLHASRSELKALRAQVNPHFLFNALNAIAGLIPKDPRRAEETVEQLAEVFRYTLRRSENETVRLEDELDFVRSYLEIEKARFGDRLRVGFEIASEAKSAVIPTMMIQTLVENAIKHGVASVRGAGRVEIGASLVGDCVRIEVRDNGPGFRLDEALSDAPGRSGHGLRNLVQRLNAHYGSCAELDVRRDAEAGQTIVSVLLPTSL